jgi:hypothetical protein
VDGWVKLDPGHDYPGYAFDGLRVRTRVEAPTGDINTIAPDGASSHVVSFRYRGPAEVITAVAGNVLEEDRLHYGSKEADEREWEALVSTLCRGDDFPKSEFLWHADDICAPGNSHLVTVEATFAAVLPGSPEYTRKVHVAVNCVSAESA